MKRYLSCFSAVAFSITLANSAQADSQQEALDRIADFADRMCAVIELKGENQSLNISGKLDVEFSSLLKKLADLGVEGAIDKQNSSYSGVPHEQLVEALSGSTDCKLLLWNDLKEKLLVESFSSSDEEESEYLDRYKDIQTFNKYCSSDSRSRGAQISCTEGLCEIKFQIVGSNDHQEIDFDISHIKAKRGTHINLTNPHLDIECKFGECIYIKTNSGRKFADDEYDIYYSNTDCIDEIVNILN